MDISSTLGEIRDEAEAFAEDPYLLTVDADHHPHCIPTPIDWVADKIVARAPSKWAGSEECGHRNVSLLWAPPQPGGYSLIVDGTAEATGEAREKLSILPTRAVLHRPGPGSGKGKSSCEADCVPIFPAQPAARAR